MRLLLDPPVGMSDQVSPLPGNMAGGERLGADLIDTVSPRRLADDDRPHTLDRAGIIDPFASVTDAEHGLFPRTACRSDHDDPSSVPGSDAAGGLPDVAPVHFSIGLRDRLG
jgi:hypothetical protein